jgi:hypothetical protein
MSYEDFDLSKIDKEDESRYSEKVIDNYLKRWNIDEKKVFDLGGGTSNVQTIKQKRKIGDTWKENDRWYQQRDGYVYISNQKPLPYNLTTNRNSDLFKYSRCSCGKKITNENELKIFKATNICIKCNNNKELEQITSGKEYEPPKWKNDIIIKDSFNQPLVSLQEYEKSFGSNEAQKIKTKVDKIRNERTKEKTT